MLRFRIPDILLGAIFGVATLGLAIFAVGFVLGSSQFSGQSQGPKNPIAAKARMSNMNHGGSGRRRTLSLFSHSAWFS
jgi:hypothetical protein